MRRYMWNNPKFGLFVFDETSLSLSLDTTEMSLFTTFDITFSNIKTKLNQQIHKTQKITSLMRDWSHMTD